MLRKVSFCILSAFLSALPYINGNLWIFAWFGFVPLFFALKNQSKAKAFLLSYLTGVVFWLLTVYWLVHVTLLGTIVLILYLALYFGIFGLIIKTCEPRTTNHAPLFIASIWVILEYLRSHLLTGFPWALLAYSQYKNLPIIQIADITGVWGVSFVVMTVNEAIYVIARREKPDACLPAGRKQFKKWDCFSSLAMTIILLLIVLIYGYYKLYRQPIADSRQQVRISVIQGNIPQELKWDPYARGFILNKYEQLTKKAASENPDLIIWPEASSPGLLGEDNSVFQEIFSFARNIKTPLLIGTVSREGKEYFNSAILVNPSGEIAACYSKLHLVPFGEYIPLKKYLPFLETVVPIGDITAGKEYTIFKSSVVPCLPAGRSRQSSANFAVLICFEDLFPELSREFVRR